MVLEVVDEDVVLVEVDVDELDVEDVVLVLDDVLVEDDVLAVDEVDVLVASVVLVDDEVEVDVDCESQVSPESREWSRREDASASRSTPCWLTSARAQPAPSRRSPTG